MLTPFPNKVSWYRLLFFILAVPVSLPWLVIKILYDRRKRK